MKYTLLAWGLLMATGAFASPETAGVPNKVQVIATDGDRLISLAEAQAGAPALAARFSEIDANHDGLLSIDEVIANQPMRNAIFSRNMQDDFAAADTNGDGMLTRAEADGKMPIVSDLFGEMDANSDGYVTQEEIREHAKKHGGVRFFRERGPVPAGE